MQKILSRDSIKPSSPTPPHLRFFKLSLLDQLAPRMYTPLLYLYPKDNTPSLDDASKSLRLKASLSEILTSYYPFAGRLTEDRLSIECNDEGIEFWEAQIACEISEIIKKPEGEALDLLFRPGIAYSSSYSGSLVVVQVSFFDCGGTAISVCITHKIADGSSICAFMNDWAAQAIQSREKVSPVYIAKSISYSPNEPISVPEILLQEGTCRTKRFSFDASKIDKLRATAKSSQVQSPTRVEAVTGLIYGCLIATSMAKSGISRPSILIQLVNMRPRVVPPLPEGSIGNFTWYFTIVTGNERVMMKSLVGDLRKGLEQLCDKNENDLRVNEWVSAIHVGMKEVKTLFDDLEVYRCSSFCSFPFYEADFGWGRPALVRMARNVVKNVFVLIGTKEDGGIDAWVTLEEQDMAVFQNEVALAFDSLDPVASI
ncbi:Vinorine synthase [Bertholletia excelsa]